MIYYVNKLLSIHLCQMKVQKKTKAESSSYIEKIKGSKYWFKVDKGYFDIRKVEALFIEDEYKEEASADGHDRVEFTLVVLFKDNTKKKVYLDGYAVVSREENNILMDIEFSVLDNINRTCQFIEEILAEL